MRHASKLLALVFSLPLAAAAQQRIPFSFDAGVGAQPTRTQGKLASLNGAVPSWFHLPSDFVTVTSAPDGVTTPTTQLWLSPEIAAAYARLADAGVAPMTWPATTACGLHSGFTLPATTLLATGAGTTCAVQEAALLSQLSTTTLTACVDVAEPERYVNASTISSSLSQSALNSYVDAHSTSLEQLVALAGAGLSKQPIAEGVLPPEWVPTMRTILWKVRAAPLATRLSDARAAYAQVLSTLSSNAACFDASRSSALTTQVQQLDAELAALSTTVTTAQSSGVTRASQQAACLVARGRTRPTLPYPALTDEEREFIGFWLGGVYWRMRGGGLLPLGSTQNARTYFARRPFKEIARLANGTSTGDRAADGVYCTLFDGWGEWMDMGTTPGDQDMYEDLVQMTDRGRQQVADWPLSAIGAAIVNGITNTKSPENGLRDDGYDTTAFYAGGLAMGPCYLYALNPNKDFVYYTAGSAPAPYSGFLDGFTALGEFCTGASIGLGMTRSLLNGTSTGQAPTTLCGASQCGVDACGNSCGSCSGTSSCVAGQCVAPHIDAGFDAGLSDAGAADAGPVVAGDAGPMQSFDAGLRDAGLTQSTDSGTPTALDGGVTPDAGTSTPVPTTPPCGCSTVPDAAAVIMLVTLRGLRRRR